MKKLKRVKAKHFNDKKEQTNQIKSVKKQTDLSKYNPYNPYNIEYISIISQDLDVPVYYIAISTSKSLEVISDSGTTSKDAIVHLLEQIKQSFLSIGGYVSIGERKPLINIHKSKLVTLISDDEIDGKKANHARIMLSNGQTCETQPEISDSCSINTGEYLYYTFWSRRNESVFGK